MLITAMKGIRKRGGPSSGRGPVENGGVGRRRGIVSDCGAAAPALTGGTAADSVPAAFVLEPAASGGEPPCVGACPPEFELAGVSGTAPGSTCAVGASGRGAATLSEAALSSGTARGEARGGERVADGRA